MHRKRAYTLVEILMVLGVILLVVLIVIYNALKMRDKAVDTAIRADLKTLEKAVDMFRLEQGRYPKSWEELKPYITGADRVSNEYELNTSLE